jgi:hypothetical protein
VGRPPPAGSGRDGRWRGPSGGAVGHPRVAQEGGARGQQKPHTGGEKNISFAHTCKLGQWLSAIFRRNLGRKNIYTESPSPRSGGWCSRRIQWHLGRIQGLRGGDTPFWWWLEAGLGRRRRRIRMVRRWRSRRGEVCGLRPATFPWWWLGSRSSAPRDGAQRPTGGSPQRRRLATYGVRRSATQLLWWCGGEVADAGSGFLRYLASQFHEWRRRWSGSSDLGGGGGLLMGVVPRNLPCSD